MIKRRIIAIGDLHGDYQITINCLKVAGVINKDLKWCGNDTIVIQIGDQVDRGGRYDTFSDENSDIKIIRFFDKLHKEAKLVGGGVYSLIGNHELMNIIGDFSYVSDNSLSNERRELFKPKTGSLALILARRPLVIKIKDLMFSHAKIEKSHLEILKKNNKDIFYINYIWKNFLENNRVALEDKEIFDNIILISCDNIRKILYGNKYKQNKKDETLVWNKFYHLLEKELNNNTNVDIIIDNTNCKYTYYIKIFTLIKDKSQWEVEVIKFNHSLWKLYLRNIIRYIKTGKFIPFKIIKIMKHNYNELDFKLIDKIFKK